MQVIINYFTFRAEHMEDFGKILPSAAKEPLGAHMAVVLPKRDREGRKILYFNPGMFMYV